MCFLQEHWLTCLKGSRSWNKGEEVLEQIIGIAAITTQQALQLDVVKTAARGLFLKMWQIDTPTLRFWNLPAIGLRFWNLPAIGLRFAEI